MARFKHFVAASAALATLGALAACGPNSGAGNGAHGGVFTTIDANNPITPGAPMNPYNANGNSFVSYNTMYLGFDKKNPLNPNDAFPGLAKSWQTKDGSLIVHLQDDAKWSDGTPVSLEDLKLSMALGYTKSTAAVGARGLTEGLNVSSVEKTGDNAFEFKQAPGTTNLTFTKQILSQVIVNAKVYGHLAPADIWDTIHATQQVDPGKAKAAQAAVATLTEIGKKVAAFAPAKDISAGPFVVRKLNPGSVILDKNKYFYDADKISPKQVVVRHYSGNEQIWGFMKNGELDAAPFTAIPENVLKQIEAKGYKRTESVSYVQASLAFNQSRAPYDKKEVRQGLAYLLDREAATKVGQPVGGKAAAAPTGMVGAMANTWMTKDQISALEPYAHDTAKAEALFRKAGLTKKGGKWYLANGKQWKMTLQTVNGFSDWISSSTVIANQLTKAGIDTKPQLSADFGKYQTDMADEKFDVGWWLTAVGSTAGGNFQRLYGSADGFSASGAKVVHSDKKGSGNWMHGPVTVTVDGKSVNPGELTAQLPSLDNEAAKPVIEQLAQVTDQEVPIIPIWDYTNVKFYNEKSFTKFPQTGQDELLSNFPGLWMAQGYIQPKK